VSFIVSAVAIETPPFDMVASPRSRPSVEVEESLAGALGFILLLGYREGLTSRHR